MALHYAASLLLENGAKGEMGRKIERQKMEFGIQKLEIGT